MISEIVIPELGATGGDVSLMAWLVQPGDSVKAGQPLFIVETDKATVEVEAFRDGVIQLLKEEPGATLAPGSVVALIADSMEETADQPESPKKLEKSPPAAKRSKPRLLDDPHDRRVLASPLARRMAQEEGINLATLTGTGTEGQVLKRDVEAWLKASETGTRVPRHPGGPQGDRMPLSPARRAIAGRTTRSKREAPHFYAAMTIDMFAALDLRRQAVGWAEEHGWAAPTITDLCIRATAMTLKEFPSLNASFDEDAIITYPDINIGLVIALDGNMIIPVLHRADRLNLYALAEATSSLKERAESGHLRAGELSGGTFTLSNLGMFGLDSFTAVLNPPEAGVLALGAVKEQPAVIEGQVVPRPLMTATLSVDHRVVDGVTAGRFMKMFAEMLENPARLALEEPKEID